MRLGWMVTLMTLLAGCSNFTPREKVAIYDPATHALVLPHPCPDWSQSQTSNYLNEPHSNYGCAVNTNSALQVADPHDLLRGHGENTPDTGITTKVVEDYRAGKLPVALKPNQTATGEAAQ
jgi:type IV pilus biogenesis protein CpaD/CtpE